MTPMDLIQKYGQLADTDSNILSKVVGFSLKKVNFPHRQFRDALCRIAEVHHYSKENSVSDGLLIRGVSGVGKSTIIKHYESSFPRYQGSGSTQIPVLYVETPSSPSVKSLAQAILVALGDPMAHRGSTAEKTEKIFSYLSRCEVEVLLLDEFHHFFYVLSVNKFREITDWLKNLMNRLHCALVLCGLPEATNVVRSNSQLWRRFSAQIDLRSFNQNDEADWLEFRGLLQVFESTLPMPAEAPLHEANMARRFYVASGGRLDYVRKVLEGGVTVAARAGLTALDLSALAAGFRERVWQDVPDRLNPFHPQAVLRVLDRVGEPFEPDSHAQMIGSPVARRLGMVNGMRRT
jgi:hypothetical protein